MRVKVKKKILFNLLKTTLNENRTNHNPTGNFVFPFQKDDEPIKPVAHMSTQLSVEKPPVDDPYFVPGSASELSSAASVIAKEVPHDQIDFFYRKLHQLLDTALDNHDDAYDDLLSEGIDLLSEQQTEVQTYIQSAIKRMSGIEDASDIASTLVMIPAFEDEELDEIQIENMLVNAFYESQVQGFEAPQPDPVEQKPQYTQVQAHPEDEGLPEITDEEHDSYLDSMSRSSAEDSEPQSFGDPVVDLAIMTHDLLFKISRRVEKDYFDAHFTPTGQEAMKSGSSAGLNQTTRMYGISNDYVFTHLNLNKKVKGQYYFSDAKIRLEIEKFINKYITLSDQKYNDLLESAAATLGKSTSETIQIVSDILTQKYVEERTAYQEIPDDEFLDKKITTLFSIVIRKEPYNFKNVSRHFMNRAEPEQLNDIIEDMMTVLAKNKQGTDYIFKKGGKTYTYPSEQVDNLVSGYAQTMFDQATDYQYQKSASDVESGEFDVVLSDEDKAAQAFAKKIAKLSTTTNFDNLAPFFGFSGASGLRQWYLKHALRKIKGLGIGLSPGGDKEGFAKLYEETFEAIAPFLGDALEAKIKELESQPTLDDQGKQKLLIVKHALPQIRELDQVIQSGNFLIGQEEGKEEGHDLLYTVGGYILRSVNGEIYKPIMNVIDKDWTSFVAEIIQSKTTANAKTSKSLAEYFTGKKEIPDYDEMTKAAKNLLKAGIDYKIFTEILDASNDWFDDTLSTEFDQFDTGEDTIQGEFLQAILKTIEKLTKKPKEMSKQLDKAIDEYLKDLAYQIAFKNLSQYETESGD